MADNTTNYAFNLPEVDGSEDLWGDLLNQNWSNLDTLLLARDQDFAALEGRTLTAGDGLSGGGNLTQDRTIAMGTPGTLDGGTPNNVTGDSHTHAITSTASRTSSSTTTLLQAAGMNSHRTSGDHDGRYARLAGGAAANFSTMPQVGGDPVVESGSNSDGRWARWADGTQLQSTRTTLSPVDLSVQSSQESANKSWPATWASDPVVTFTPSEGGSDRLCVMIEGLTTDASPSGAPTVNGYRLRVRTAITFSGTTSILGHIIASGRWK